MAGAGAGLDPGFARVTGAGAVAFFPGAGVN